MFPAARCACDPKDPRFLDYNFSMGKRIIRVAKS
jgi:hypothetical protein